MHNLTKANEIYEELKSEGKLIDEMFKVFKEKMPEQFCELMHIIKYGCHIHDEELYNKAVALLVWVDDKGKGARWTKNDIIKLATNIDFNAKKYTEYDFAFSMNKLYALYCNAITEPSYYLKMTKDYLEDPNKIEDPSERAYHYALKQIKHHTERTVV